jgi:transcriptional regulator with XRE-family HTH domain
VTGMTLTELLLVAQAKEWAESGQARQLRVSAGLTQEQVGEHCGVGASAVSHWESAERHPRGRPALRWARLLDQLAARSTPAVPA